MQHATALARPAPAATLTDAEMAAYGFLARYNGETLRAYRLDLRDWFAWCTQQGLDPLRVRRPHIELYARWLEEYRTLAVGTRARRLTTVAGFYRLAHIDGYLDTNPAAYVRRPRVPTESQRLGLDRTELMTFLARAQQGRPDEAALAMLLGVLGLRVSEACGVQLEDLGAQRGHRTLQLIGKGGQPAMIPLPPPVARAIDAAAGHRTTGPLLHTSTGHPAEPSWARRVVRRVARRAGITKTISPHSLRHSCITAALDAGVPLRDVQIAARHSDPRTTLRYDRARHNLDRHAAYVVSAYVTGAA